MQCPGTHATAETLMGPLDLCGLITTTSVPRSGSSYLEDLYEILAGIYWT